MKADAAEAKGTAATGHGMIVPLGRDAETAFMTRVLPWPKKDEPGYVQLWWRKPNPNNPKKPFWPKKNVRSVGEFFTMRQWGLAKFPDSYFCTALQREEDTRNNKNTLLIKSLRMDIDVKKEKGYGSLEEAIIAVAEFCERTGIPLPNAWVCSGGGLHVYWIGDRDLTVEQWQPYAEGLKAFAMERGLKCDHGCTAVPSHILRIPGTFNSKSNLRRPVYLLDLIPHDFDFATELAMLPGKKLVKPKPAKKPQSTLQPSTAEAAALPFAPVKAECGWLRHVHDTGGIDQDEPLWRDALRVCIFLKDGERLIHEFSNKYEGYDLADTKAKYDQAREYKEADDLGWPKCETIHGDGCAHCETCPHLAAGGSPLHLARRVPSLPSARDDYEPVTRDAPELAKLDAVWVTRIFEGDANDPDLAFTVACELVRIELDSDFIARVLMTTPCGVHVQENPAYRLNRTIRRAYEFAIDPDLERMNSQHAVLPIGDKTRIVTWGDDSDFPGYKTIVRAQTFEDFKNLHSNKRKIIETIDKDGNLEEAEIPLGAWWLNQKDRRQYDGGQKFMPQHEAEAVKDVLNMFEGWPIRPRKPEGRSGASGCQLFLDHGFKVMCSGNADHWDYLLKREAWIAQNRRRCEVAAAFRTEEEGAGKGFWCNHLGHLYGPHYMQVKRSEHVVGTFNRHLETLIKLYADEALFVGDPKHRDTLFGLITEPTIDVRPLYIDLYSAPNYLNIDIGSNKNHFVPVSRTARRFFISTVSLDHLKDFEYFAAIEHQLKNGGYEALLFHLLYEVDLRDFEVRDVPKTAGLAEQAAYSRKGVDGLVEKACSEGYVLCPHFEWPGYSIATGQEERKGFDYLIDNHNDKELRYLGALRVKHQLRKEWRCITGKNARRREGGAIIRGIQWPPLQELRALFTERHGPQDWLNPDITEWPKGPDPVETGLAPASGPAG
jgi:hypothetical protein